MKVKLKGKSRKGKNRVHEWGEIWTVIRDDKFDGRPAWGLETQCGKDWRWVHKENDKDFEVEIIEESV